MKVAIVGSRSVGAIHYPTLCEQVPRGASMIISGGAEGADRLARRYAAESGLSYVEIRPDYAVHGRSAPLRRNQEIVHRADYVLVLWDGRSRGSAYVIKYCLDTGTPVRVLICHPDGTGAKLLPRP